MSFPTIYRAISDLVMDECLQDELARGIARKAGLRLGASGATSTAPDLMGQFNLLNDNDLGYTGNYLASASFAFPDDSQWMDSFEDGRGLSQARLLVTVTEVGLAGSSVFVEVVDGAGVSGFETAPPSAPLDTLGLHISEWQTFTWDPSAPGERKALLRWRISNPLATTGAFSVGLCQLQVRG